MLILKDVDLIGIDPRLYVWLCVIAELHHHTTGAPLVVTSVRRPRGKRQSRHSPPAGALVTAADIRRWDLDKGAITEKFCRTLQAQYGDFLGIVLEPEWLSEHELAERGGRDAVAPHVHVQLKGAGWTASS